MLVPQITGDPCCPGAVIENESIKQDPGKSSVTTLPVAAVVPADTAPTTKVLKQRKNIKIHPDMIYSRVVA